MSDPIRGLCRLLGRPNPSEVIEGLEKANRAWQDYGEGLRQALMDERRSHGRTLRLLEEASTALAADVTPGMCSTLAECARHRSAATETLRTRAERTDADPERAASRTIDASYQESK